MEDFDEEVVLDVEESETPEKVGIFKRIYRWCGEHPAIMSALITAGLSVGSTAYKHYVSTKEYEDYLYVTTDSDEIARIPARKMQSVKHGSWRRKKNPR